MRNLPAVDVARLGRAPSRIHSLPDWPDMYIPAPFEEARPEVLFEFIEQHPLGLLITMADGSLTATHLPVVLDRSRGASGMLQAHVAKANAHAAMAGDTPCLVVFSGPQAYISPEWYASKRDHGRVVPTWDYVAVHVDGIVRRLADAASLRAHLEKLTNNHEAHREHPWHVGDAPASFIESSMRAIVGLEIEITRMRGVWKVSQNRSGADIDGVVSGLTASDDHHARELARVVETRRRPPDSSDGHHTRAGRPRPPR